MYQQQYNQPRGALRRALGWHARRSNPTVWRPQPKLPFWARHPVMWLVKGFIKAIGVVLIVPVVAVIRPERHRKLAPWCLIAWLWALSAVLHTVPSGWQILAVSAAIGTPFLYWQLGLPLGRRLTRTRTLRLRHRIGILATVTSGIGLLALAAAVPAMLFAPGYWLVWVPAGAFATGWWGRHDEPEPEPEEEPTEAPPVDPRIELWDRKIAPKYHGARLTDLKDLDGVEEAWRGTIDLSDTDLTVTDMLAAGPFIAARNGLPLTSATVEAHESGRGDKAVAMVFPVNPLQDIVRFEGLSFDPDTGYVVVGKHTDGRPARWRLFAPGWGACHGIIFGVTGSGKSGLLNALIVEARHSGVVCPILADPHNGKSFADVMDNVTVFAGAHSNVHPRIYTLLKGLERIIGELKRQSTSQGTYRDSQGRVRRRSASFKPTREKPLLLLIIDEWPKVAKDALYGEECIRIVTMLLEDGRKFGIAVILVQQLPGLEDMGGKSSLRSNASGTNIAAFRTSDRVSASMGIPMNLPVDPVDLPAEWPNGESTAGLGFLARGSAPASPMRGVFIPADQDDEERDELIEWMTTGNLCPLPDRLARVGGPFFSSWRQLVDIDEENVIAVGPDGEWIRIDDDPTAIAEASVSDSAKQTAWEKLSAVLARKSWGATTAVLRDETGLRHNTVCTTLRRYDKAAKCHEVNGVWHLGPADTRQDEREKVGAA